MFCSTEFWLQPCTFKDVKKMFVEIGELGILGIFVC